MLQTIENTTQSHSRILYGSDPLITLDQLRQVPTPAPRGRFHRPVPFGEFASETVHALEREGLEVVHQEYQTTNENERVFGAMVVTPAARQVEGEYISAQDWELIVGLRGSHDQSVSRGLVLGSRVMVCSNLCFSGDLGSWHTKQTTNIDTRLPGVIRAAIERLPGMQEAEQELFERLRNQEMRERWGDAALVEMHRRGALPGPQLVRAISEWKNPSHSEHITEAGHDWSGWRLFNAATEALKPSGATHNHFTQEKRSREVRGFMAEVVGL